MNFIRHSIDTLRNWLQTDTSSALEEADAIVLQCHGTGMERNGMLQADLLLHVTPKHGRNYIAEYQTYFPRQELQKINSGAKIKIYYQSNNPMKIHWAKN